MEHLDRKAIRQLNEFSHDVWRRIGDECLMQGIPTARGMPPHYCGDGAGWPILSHTIPANVIDEVNGDYKEVVTFSPRVEVSRWSPNEMRGPVFPKTPIDVASVGRYACNWHDGLFDPIDSAPFGLTQNNAAATLIALRATLMEYFLAFRHSEYFGKRADYCRIRFERWSAGPQECGCRKGWKDHRDDDERNAEQAFRRHVPVLLREIKNLVGLVKGNDWSEIVASEFFLPGEPKVGGTVVWISYLGDPMTLTIVPVKDGHHFYFTHHAKPANVVQKVVADLMSNRVSNSRKSRILSEIVLHQNWAMFILKPKWCSMSQDERDMIRIIADEMGMAQPLVKTLRSSLTRYWRRLRSTRAWALKGDPRVPDLFS